MDVLNKFCGSPFWDNNLTWYTDDPYFTSCFEQTVLVWIPAALLLIILPFEMYWYWRHFGGRECPGSGPGHITFSPLNISKFVLNTTLIITQLALLIPTIFKTDPVAIIYPVDVWTSVVQAIIYSLALLLLFVTNVRGVRSSGTLFYFWALTVVCDSIVFRTHINSPPHIHSKDNAFLFVVNVISYISTLGLFVLTCWADVCTETQDGYNQTHDGSEAGPCPEKSSSQLSQLLFEWYGAIMWKGWRRPLEHKDLWDLSEENSSRTIVPAFCKIWTRELCRKKNSTQISVLPVLFKAFGSTFMVGCIMKVIPDLMVFVNPMILQVLIGFINNPNEEIWKGWLYTAIMFASAIIQTLITVQCFHRIHQTSLRVRTALVNAIYRKALVVSNSVKQGTTLGEIVNLMSVDAQKIMDLVPFVQFLWTIPLQVSVAFYLQWGILGPASIAGFIILILIVPINIAVVNKTRALQLEQMRYKDDRVKLMNEILSGIKTLKLYAWEPSFQAQVETIRAKEIRVLRLEAYLGAAVNFLWMCAPFLISVATFTTFVLIDEKNTLDATKAFVSISIFSVIHFSLTLIPALISALTQGAVGLRRINKFMNAEEIDPNMVTHQKERDSIVIENGYFNWGEAAESQPNVSLVPILREINLRVPNGSLIAIVGSVGCGKSTLLAALIGETNKLSGRVNTVGTIAYVAQQAWIQNLSLRDNILFGEQLDKGRYEKVVRACALKPDIEMLPDGDKTEIGEKGINLSGGQKQRVAVARAIYSNSDVYLFDDPLSAVDSHVGKHIFEQVLGPNGLLKRKTRVLVTHGITFLPQVDQIIVIKHGKISELGTYEQLIDAKGAFAEFLAQHANDNIDGPESNSGTENEMSRNQRLKTYTTSISASTSLDMDRKSVRFQSLSTASASSKGETQKLIQVETTETEGVKFSIYFTYFKAAGWNLTISTLVLYTLFQGFSVGGNLILSSWSELPIVNGTQDVVKRDTYLALYGAFGFLQAIAIGIACATMAHGLLKAATGLHHQMLYRILRCPMSFFDTTPVGRIINRFAKDCDTLDTLFPNILKFCLNSFFQMISTLVVISYTTPIFLVVIVPIGAVYALVQNLYVRTGRQLKRLESVSRSPIYSHFGESVVGAATIRAYRQNERFIKETEHKIDFNQKACFPMMTSNRWRAVRLETVGNLVIFFAALFAVLGRETLNPSLAALSVTYALQITQSLNMLVRWFSEFEANLVAVERMKEYMEVPQEAEWEIKSRKPPTIWPEQGQVEFKGYKTRYRKGLDFVLHNITCKILPGEKIGIVGRTGAGKSSLTLGLFRIVEAAGGSILIDRIDIAMLGLHDVRGRITIIPQDPVLFSGSLRFNLDPFVAHCDTELWHALELAHLGTFVKGLPAGLNHEISEGGDNLSVGQRQLVCLARALLRKTKILVLDEATAAIDLDTDDLIQATIRAEFKESTVITIAHRLNTIMDSTRVLVLDKGEIREFDTPANLLKDEDSIFYSMAKDAGFTQ